METKFVMDGDIKWRLEYLDGVLVAKMQVQKVPTAEQLVSHINYGDEKWKKRLKWLNVRWLGNDR